MKILLLGLMLVASCTGVSNQQTSDSGVTKASVQIKTDNNGHTAEQNNIMEKNVKDNEIGAVKHLYIISSYTGDVLEYSTVRGKVTSGGKRLSPRSVNGGTSTQIPGSYNYVNIGGNRYTADEVLDDGGAYGESANYVYWFDAQDNFQQYYPSGGTYMHISDRPLRIKRANLTVTMESEVQDTVKKK